MFQTAARLAMMVLVLAATCLTAAAQTSEPRTQAEGAGEGGDVPERTAAMRRALEAASWEEAEEGYFLIRAETESGQSLVAFRLAPDLFAFSLAVQDNPKGERVEDFAARGETLIAINGGFFGEEEESGRLFPVGLLRLGDRDYSQAWESTGGMAVLNEGRMTLRPSVAGVPEQADSVLQSKPMLIEPGGRWAMNTDQGYLRHRSLLCLLENGEALVVAISGAGMSLYEAGWLLRGGDAGGFFGCDAALALDGGGSTQLWVAGHADLTFTGETPVHNALIVRARKAGQE